MRRLSVVAALVVAIVLGGPVLAGLRDQVAPAAEVVRTVRLPDGTERTVRVPPPPSLPETEEPQVTRLLRRLRAENADRGASDDPNIGAPTSVADRFIPQERNLPVGRIAIPSIGLDVAFRSGVHDSIVELGPGHWPGTPLPGNAGNAVLSGHRTTFTRPFGDLDLLQPGERIRIRRPDRQRATYAVTDVAIVAEADYVDYVTRQPGRARARQLTLFACHPKGQRTHRIVVRAEAEPISSADKPTGGGTS